MMNINSHVHILEAAVMLCLRSSSTLHIRNGAGMAYLQGASLFISRSRMRTQSSQTGLNLRLLWGSQKILGAPTFIIVCVCFPVYEKIEKV